MTRERSPSAAEPPAPRSGSQRRRHRDPRSLPLYGVYRRFRNLAFGDPAAKDDESLARLLVRALVEEIPTSSPILGVRLYRRDGDEFVLLDSSGEAGGVAPGYRVPASHPVIEQSRRDGWALVRRGDSRFDEWMERTGGTHAIAKLVLGPGRDLLLSFTLREPIATAEVLNALTALGSLADSALERRQFRQLLEQARAVQTSLLPRTLPAIPGFELAVRQRPAEVVGGDVYDLARVGDDALAVCIADATGHGLPAALQARDVIVGLRMGMALQLKMVAIVDKLSRVLADSSASGRYVSFFFAEIDRDGHLIYINAGHPPPLLVGREPRRVERLRTSGPILGLDRKAARPWVRIFERLAPGDLLALYTDGITEVRRADDEEEYGLERLQRFLLRHAGEPLEALADRLFAEVDAFGGDAPMLDDQTLLLVRRT
ncbi:MAG TPA: PP2C family protein-serine/threonine phosphatase [Thermoanaerobaculia bacterium]|nr:PP2C family protein-serine/threonine phosphatase [Thermoanaerobaculia bacterium]